MDTLDLQRVQQFVNENIDVFHQARLQSIQNVRLWVLLKRKNPYLFKAKNINTASALVQSLLDATLSSSEEGIFGHFLEELAIFVNQITYGGQKSSSPGIDLDFNRDGIRYVVAVKSGPNWGNSSQYAALRRNFREAIRILRQSSHIGDVRAVLGCCYGKGRAVDNGEFIKIQGQSFWEFISGDANLYIDLIEPIGYQAFEHNAAFIIEKDVAFNRLVEEFQTEFCDVAGQIDWAKLVRFNSGQR